MEDEEIFMRDLGVPQISKTNLTHKDTAVSHHAALLAVICTILCNSMNNFCTENANSVSHNNIVQTLLHEVGIDFPVYNIGGCVKYYRFLIINKLDVNLSSQLIQ